MKKTFNLLLLISIAFAFANCSSDKGKDEKLLNEENSTTVNRRSAADIIRMTQPNRQRFQPKLSVADSLILAMADMAFDENLAFVQEESPLAYKQSNNKQAKSGLYKIGQTIYPVALSKMLFGKVDPKEIIEGTVYGSVININGKAAANETIWLLSKSGKVLAETKTGADGSFKFENLPIQQYQLIAVSGNGKFKYKPNNKPFGENTAKILYDKALAHYNKKEYNEAENLINKVLALDNKNYDAQLLKGEIHEAKLEYSAALSAYAEAVAQNQHDAVAIYREGVIKSIQEKYPEALIDLNKAVTENPKNADAYFQRGLVHNNLNEQKEALADYQQFVKLETKSAPGYFNMGTTYANLGEYTKAIECFNKAIKLNPTDGECYLYRGMCYQEQANSDAALADYDQALKLKKSLEAFLRKAEVCEVEHEFKQAESVYQEALQYFVNDAELYNHRGVFYSNRKKFALALQDLNKAIELESKNGEYYANRAQVLLKLKKKKEACTDIVTAKGLGFQVNSKLELKACK